MFDRDHDPRYFRVESRSEISYYRRERSWSAGWRETRALYPDPEIRFVTAL